MELALNALITPRRIIGFFDNKEDPEDLIPLINYASGAIRDHCNRPLVFRREVRILDSVGETVLRLPAKPLMAVVSLRYDQTRVFDDTTELTDFSFSVDRGEIYLPTSYGYADAVFRVETDEGYFRIDYNQDIEPENPQDQEVWQRKDGTLARFEGGRWVDFFGLPMPEALEGACAEYVSYLKVRMKTGGAGVSSLKRGYAFEGSEVSYEKAMPKHIQDRLQPYVSYL